MIRLLTVPETALTAGFSNGPGSAHNSRTIMLAELRALLSATSRTASAEEYRHAVVAANELGKATVTTREKTYRYLRELYALDPARPVFAAMRELWPLEHGAQPLLAMLCALSRDRALRATAEQVAALSPGDHSGSAMLSTAIEDAMPGRYNAEVRARMGRNVAASWTQAGHLEGSSTKTRVRPKATYPAVAYALYLGHLEGVAGQGLYQTLWARVLDMPLSRLEALTETAARTGWIDLRKAGGMTEITFRHLDSLTGWGEA